MISSRKSSTEPVMRAFFRLEQADMDAVVHIHGAADVKWATCFKRADGFRQIALDTRPTRDLTPRHSSLEAIVALAGDPVLDNLCAEADYPWEPDRFNRVQQYLQQTDETLPPETLNDIHAFVDSLSRLDPGRNDPDSDPDAVDHEASQRRMDAVAKINALLVHEEEDTPANQVAGILRTRLPEFLLFGEAERNLLGTYDLNAEDGQPVALRNLGALAGLDFDVLKGAINNDVGTAESMVEDANARLKADFEESWGSDIYLRLRTDDAILRVLTRNETGVGYSEWGDRSDGVRAFAALRAFIAGRRDPKPVLLIDEIESHLHYDAQVDLVDVLTEQHLAAKVIYTTHSVGCLPQDLGSGIRAVEPVVDGERECSRFVNSFWGSGPGLSRLLFGMGASLLPYTAPRRGLFAEGASDAVLLPTLLREASNTEALNFRVMPGLANANSADIREIDSHAGRTVFLVDGDESGDALVEFLTKAGGIDASKIIRLSVLPGSPTTVEDLVARPTMGSR